MSDTIYLKCSAKARSTQYGTMINVGIKATDLIEFARAHANSRGYVNLTISERKEPGKYGDTHSVKLDAYEPKQQGQGAPSKSITADDVPF